MSKCQSNQNRRGLLFTEAEREASVTLKESEVRWSCKSFNISQYYISFTIEMLNDLQWCKLLKLFFVSNMAILRKRERDVCELSASVSLSSLQTMKLSLLKKQWFLRWPRELNALQLQKTHANRKSTSKSWKHLHQFDSRCCKCSQHKQIKKRTANAHNTTK